MLVGVSVSVNSNITGPSINTSISVFTIAAGCFMALGNTQNLTCWHPKIVVTLKIWISCPSSSYFCFLYIFEKTKK